MKSSIGRKVNGFPSIEAVYLLCVSLNKNIKTAVFGEITVGL